MTPRDGKVYVVIGLNVDDATYLDDQDSDNADNPTKYREIFASLTDEEARSIAEAMCDFLWDSDLWELGLRERLDSVAAEKVRRGYE